MKPKRFSTGALVATCVCTLVLGACQNDQGSSVAPDNSLLHNPRSAPAFAVYSQNVYLGGDTGPLFTIGDFSDLGSVLAATGPFWDQVQASDVPARAASFVDEIERDRPDVVGLQEAFRFILLDGGFQPIGSIDLLTAIENEIADRGLPYETALVQDGTSSTLPLAFDPTVGVTSWLNFTDRIAVLKRTTVPTLEAVSGQYTAGFPLGPLELRRGWARLTVEHADAPYHFIVTHLETQALLPVHSAQADELRNVVAAGLDGVTIIAGDLNSDAAAGPGAPSWTPTYESLIGDGFTDVWDVAPQTSTSDGVTCCHDPELGDTRLLDERIDLVLVRTSASIGGPAALPGGLFRAEIVGTDEEDRTPGGLWPSDHAGLVASMRLPAPLR